MLSNPPSFPQSWWSRPAGGRDVLRLALPLVISSLSWTVMTFTDRMFLTWYAQDALAAALPAAVVMWTVICLPWGVCCYANTFVSQYHGAGRPQRIGPAVWQGVWAALAGVPLVMATVPLAPWMFGWAGHSPAVQQQEIQYYQILCYGAVFMLPAEALSSFFTGRGLTFTVMVVNTLTAAVNVVLDYLWIFGYAGFPTMGIAGAAWATNASLAVRVGVLLWLFLRSDARTAFGTSHWGFDPTLFRRLLRYGLPSGLQLTLEVSGFTVFMLYIGRLGEAELAATNLAFNISSLAFMPVFGLSIAASTLVGQHLGDDRDDLAAQAAWTTCALALGYMALVSLLYVGAPDVLLWGFFVWNSDAQADHLRATAIVLLRFVAAYNLFDALNMVFVGAIKGAGDTVFVLRAQFVLAVLLCGGSWLVIEGLQWGLYGSWAFVTLWVWVVGLVYLARFWQGRWRQMRVIEPAVNDLPAVEPRAPSPCAWEDPCDAVEPSV
jgi:MATE family multidrug resistance protein